MILKEDKLLKIFVEDFSLEYSLECGQFFLYEKKNEFYYIIDSNKIFKVRQEKNYLFFKGISQKDLINFFNLDLDYKKVTKDFKDDIHLKIALDKYRGLRIINSDLYSCIISFVCSAASNIPKIKNNLKLICENFGDKIIFEGNPYYTFPKIGKIKNLEKLKKCKVGYRAKYIFEINTFLFENPQFLEELKKSNYVKSKLLLQKLPGIGPKVATCICLFSLKHTQAFPIDTWVIQLSNKLYLKEKTNNILKIEKFIEKKFKENRGLKQQYLFHYARNHLK